MVALSWPEPFYPADAWLGRSYGLSADKYALLEGEVSEPSNAEGIATFQNLTVC